MHENRVRHERNHKDEEGVLDLRSNKACRLDGDAAQFGLSDEASTFLSRMEGRTAFRRRSATAVVTAQLAAVVASFSHVHRSRLSALT